MTRPEETLGDGKKIFDQPSNKTIEGRVSSVLANFEIAAASPQDSKMAAFFSASRDLANDNKEFGDFLKSALNRDITPSHFSNLFLRGVQYIEIFDRGRTDYPDSFLDPDTWKEELIGENGIIKNHSEKLQEILAVRETTTTKYQRSAGVKAVLNAVFPGQKVKIADFGCGANYTLRGINGNIPFQEDIEYAGEPDGPVSQIIELLNSKVDVENGLAVDKNQVNGREEQDWHMACNFYPGELSTDNIQAMKTLEAKMDSMNQSNIGFLQGNLLKLETNHADGTLPADFFDAVVISTLLYQMTFEEQIKIINTAKKSLNPDGIIILQDFATKDPTSSTGIRFSNDWGTSFIYRTFVLRNVPDATWQEFLQWDSGRCRTIKPGEDFDQVVNSPVTKTTKPYPLY